VCVWYSRPVLGPDVDPIVGLVASYAAAIFIAHAHSSQSTVCQAFPPWWVSLFLSLEFDFDFSPVSLEVKIIQQVLRTHSHTPHPKSLSIYLSVSIELVRLCETFSGWQMLWFPEIRHQCARKLRPISHWNFRIDVNTLRSHPNCLHEPAAKNVPISKQMIHLTIYGQFFGAMSGHCIFEILFPVATKGQGANCLINSWASVLAVSVWNTSQLRCLEKANCLGNFRVIGHFY